jgi:hypothetical protein
MDRLCVETIFLPYDAAPAAALMFLLIIAGWKWLHDFSLITRVVALIAFAFWIAHAIACIAAPLSPDSMRIGPQSLPIYYPQLTTSRHLIFVKYEPGHSYDDEWVYNTAEPESQQILWVRYMGPAADKPVIEHYPTRQDWLLDVGATQLTLKPYPNPH